MRPSRRRSRSSRGRCSGPTAARCRHAGIDSDALDGLTRRSIAVRGCRTLGKRDLVLNDALPKIDVNPDTYEVRADGELLRSDAVDVLPLAQRYFLF